MTTKPITLTLKASELRSLLGDVMPFVDKDRYTLPILRCVHLDGHGDHITAVATDRYVLGVRKIHIQAAKELHANLDSDAVRQMLAMFRTTRKDDPVLTLAFTDSKVTVESGGGLDGLILDTRVSFNLYDGTYPMSVASLFDPVTTKTLGNESFSLNSECLSRFKHLGHITLHPTGAHGVCVVRAKDFIGAAMPLNSVPGGEQQLKRDLGEWDSFRALKPKDGHTPAKRHATKKPAA